MPSQSQSPSLHGRASAVPVFVSFLKGTVCHHQNPFKKRTALSIQTLYQQKRMSAAEAVGVVMNGDTVVVPTAVGESSALLTALGSYETSTSKLWSDML